MIQIFEQGYFRGSRISDTNLKDVLNETKYFSTGGKVSH